MRVFNEIQKFNQGWLRVVLISVAGLTTLPIFFLVDWQGIGQTELIIVGGAMALTLGLLFFIMFIFRLETRIDEKGIHYGFHPIPGKNNLQSWDAITKAYVRNYSAIGEYGGWGYRVSFSKSKGKAYNVSGNVGIQLELKNGKKVLIGTQQKDAATSAINYYLKTTGHEAN